MTSTDGITVTKRTGEFETFTFEKIHKVLFWATEDISGVSVSEIEISMEMQMYNKIKTSEIQEALIKATALNLQHLKTMSQHVSSKAYTTKHCCHYIMMMNGIG